MPKLDIRVISRRPTLRSRRLFASGLRPLARPLLALLASTLIAACQPSTILVHPEDWAAVKLTEFQPSSEVQRRGTTVVILTLRQKGERPDDFYLGPVQDTNDGKVEFPLYHKSNFGERELSVGAPEGDSRIMVYDPTKNEVTNELHWQ